MTTSMSAWALAPQDEFTVGSDRIAFQLTSEQSGGEMTVWQVLIPAGGGPPMLHRHDPFELYRVRSGELVFYVEGEDGAITRTVAGPGTVVPIRGGLEHTIRNESDEEATAVVVFSPGEPMERFARAAGELGRDSAPGPEEVSAVAQAHGIEITRSLKEALAEPDVEATDSPPPSRTGYLTVARFTGDSDRLLDDYRTYSGVMAEVGRDHGLILHASAKTDEGVLVVNLWPSKNGSEAAARDPRRLSVIKQAGISSDQIQREHHEVDEFVLFD